MSLSRAWKKQFFTTLQSSEEAEILKKASIEGKLTDWTAALTRAVVATCQKSNWFAAAKGHKQACLPVGEFEYLGIDVMAFENGEKRWSFPLAAIELENSRKDDRIAYSLWKVLNLRSKLRIVFCYRASEEAGPQLIKYLSKNVVSAMEINDRMRSGGETMIVVGYRNNAETFPYGYFKWWKLNTNTGQFELH